MSHTKHCDKCGAKLQDGEQRRRDLLEIIEALFRNLPEPQQIALFNAARALAELEAMERGGR